MCSSSHASVARAPRAPHAMHPDGSMQGYGHAQAAARYTANKIVHGSHAAHACIPPTATPLNLCGTRFADAGGRAAARAQRGGGRVRHAARACGQPGGAAGHGGRADHAPECARAGRGVAAGATARGPGGADCAADAPRARQLRGQPAAHRGAQPRLRVTRATARCRAIGLRTRLPGAQGRIKHCGLGTPPRLGPLPGPAYLARTCPAAPFPGCCSPGVKQCLLSRRHYCGRPPAPSDFVCRLDAQNEA